MTHNLNQRAQKKENLSEPIFLIALIGLPASGKTTCAQTILDVFAKLNLSCLHIDIDEIRNHITDDEFNHTEEEKVRNAFKSEITKELLKNNCVIADDMNYYASMRHDLLEIVQNINKNQLSKVESSSKIKLSRYYYVSVYVNTPLDQCKGWNKQRGSPVPNSIIIKNFKRFDIPGQKYSWDEPDITIMPHLESSHEIFMKLNKFFTNIKEKCMHEKFLSLTTHKDNSQDLGDLETRKLEQDLESYTRKIISLILKLDIDNEKLHEIKKLLNIKNNLLKNTSLLKNKILATRKKFKKWILDNTKPKHLWSLDLFIEFLKDG